MKSETTSRHHAAPAKIRHAFSRAMSAMYASEVPLYGRLLSLVSHVNKTTLEQDSSLRQRLEATDDLDRIDMERHGAIRVGTPAELHSVRRVLQVMNMLPTGFYDLTAAGVPVYATCFRPHSASELSKNPFRLFVSLLQLHLITDEKLRTIATETLARRQIFSDRMYELLDICERYGGLTDAEAEEFVQEARDSFRWHASAAVPYDDYMRLLRDNSVLADIVAFRSPHINHLTPRTLDIDEVQSDMLNQGIPLKEYVEGPPKRKCPILLRQTSFKAIEEAIEFPNGNKCDPRVLPTAVSGYHTARFGEVEQRGVALTIKGRQMYDSMLQSALQDGITAAHGDAYSLKFARFPDSWEELRAEGLAWFQYRVDWDKLQSSETPKSDDLEYLIRSGYVVYEPIVYEDFLPISAAGIFQSNLAKPGTTNGGSPKMVPCSNRREFELALGVATMDEMILYKNIQDESLLKCRQCIQDLKLGAATRQEKSI
ncbi:MAG: DUF1338 family protein [Kocuria palustris]|jgi:uncharacterized glyoxalase superfamily metalloenzyme YdcJ|uniref:2-oxoadipate dioxygenase/decarboxylase n=1 Tax=Penicillium chrysogenum TaxID=5076 RepID=A0ABQ8WM85_PENCH|nr:hypothetical protein N7524_012303 [Penicillium chrysogenum]KAJ5270824.1 hypothetical protein N7505_006582 [Penicillium chrysogenum]MBZ6373599.1 DUF1338 family protein [Kocuria palustris]